MYRCSLKPNRLISCTVLGHMNDNLDSLSYSTRQQLFFCLSGKDPLHELAKQMARVTNVSIHCILGARSILGIMGAPITAQLTR